MVQRADGHGKEVGNLQARADRQIHSGLRAARLFFFSARGHPTPTFVERRESSDICHLYIYKCGFSSIFVICKYTNVVEN